MVFGRELCFVENLIDKSILIFAGVDKKMVSLVYK
jgi:hypothetical protein